MKFVLKLLRLQNWRNPRPADEIYPKKMQYTAAMIDAGIEAKIAPNFPKMEKKIIKAAEICTTLRLPTLVIANRPAFSAVATQPVTPPKRAFSIVPIPSQPTPRLMTEGGTGVALPYLADA